MNSTCSKKRYFLSYTVLFCIMVLAVYGYFFVYHKSFIYNGDGMLQHYRALCYYAQWLRDIAGTLLTEHRLVIPEWSFSIGYGSDIIGTLHYYVLGDPFNLFSVFVPVQYMEYYYMLMILVRMYCAGISFSCFCFYMFKDKWNKNAILAGSFLYVFCAYGMQASITHPYFINPMIYLPLMLMGTEKIAKKESPVLFIFTVCVSACSNFYFFYMLAVLTAVYVVSRLIFQHGLQQIRKVFSGIIAVGCYAAVGLALGAVIFLPVILTVLQDSRLGGEYLVDLIYPAYYYTRFPGSFLSSTGAGYWNLMGFAGIGLVAVILLFLHKKEYVFLKFSFILLTGFLLIPAVGYVLNGCSYTSNRWIWAYAMLIAVILVAMWPNMMRMSERRKIWLWIGMSVYFAVCCILDNSRSVNMALGFGIGLLSIVVSGFDFSALNPKALRWKDICIFVLMLGNIALNAFFAFSIKAGDYPAKYVDLDTVNEKYSVIQDVAVAEAAKEEEGFFRYTQNEIHNNSTLASGLHSTQYYWSLSNSAVVSGNAQLGILCQTHNNYLGINERTGLAALANVRYFTNSQGKGSQYAPYGFTYEGTYSASYDNKNCWDVYQNQYPLSFGYTYDSVLDVQVFEELSPVQREEAMLQGVLLEDQEIEYPTADLTLHDTEIPFEVNCGSKKVTLQENSFVATEKNTSVTLEFDGMAACETYLLWEGLNYVGCSPLDLYEEDSPFDPLDLYKKTNWEKKSVHDQKKSLYVNQSWIEPSELIIELSSTDEDKQQVKRKLCYYTPKYSWYAGQKDFAVNFSYSDGAKNSITISFPEPGIYSFESMKVICRPLTGYEERINALDREHLENVVFESDKIAGTISVASDKILCLTIPYTKGWSAYIDGEKAEIYQANMMFMGLALDKGEHVIELEYHTPGLRPGIVLSVLGLAVTFYLKRRKYKIVR